MAGISIGPVGGGGFCTQIVCGAENSGTVTVERMGQCRLSELLGYAQEALVFGGVCPEMVSHSIIVVIKTPPTKFFRY